MNTKVSEDLSKLLNKIVNLYSVPQTENEMVRIATEILFDAKKILRSEEWVLHELRLGTPWSPWFDIAEQDLEKKNRPGRKPTGNAMTNSERQKKWKDFHREVALQRQRESMKKLRAKKKQTK